MSWEDRNSEYLLQGLQWLRGRLRSLLARRLGQPEPAEEVVPFPEGIEGERNGEDPPALEILARQFGLSEFEKHCLLLCGSMEFDRSVGELCGAILGEEQGVPTLGLCLELFDEPRWDVLSTQRPLRFWQLIEIHQHGTQPLTGSPIRIDPRIAHFLRGLNEIDDRLRPLLIPFDLPGDRAGLSPSQLRLLETALDWSSGAGPRPVLTLTGRDRLAKQVFAQLLARQTGTEIHRLPAEFLPTDPAQLDGLVRLFEREGRLLPIRLHVELEPGERGERGAGGRGGPGVRFLARCGLVLSADLSEPVSIPDRTGLAIDFPFPDRAEQQERWADVLDPAHSDLASWLAGQFQFSLHRIPRIDADVRRRSPEPTGADYWAACRVECRSGMEGLAQRIDVRAGWDDLVLAEEERSLLSAIAGQAQHRMTVLEEWGFARRANRGLGVTALFAGESGTGKTMAAEVLAGHLDLDLFRIDLSQVVNKYIGETEKNLKRLFDAADDSGAILFFDEADALFGRRSEVKDSHDRYANIEVNYLLQRMESYRGVAILATNLKGSLDAAFLRRLRFVVDFAFPTPSLRRRMWERAFPGDAPVGPLDFDHLARLQLTGGSIANVALNAAFAAAAAERPVEMATILAAAKAEYRKLQRPINAQDFTVAASGLVRPRAAGRV